MLIRTEHGKTIGGYTGYPWRSEGGYYSNAEKRVFIFSLDLFEKFVPKDGYSMMWNGINEGPDFGIDLRVGDGGNSEEIYGLADFPSSYNREGEYKLLNNQTSYTMFSGAIDGFLFRVIEYEVFRLEIS